MHVSTEFLDNYERHPSFSFGAAQWSVPADVLGKFNGAYEAVRQLSSQASKSQMSLLARNCRRALNAVFDALEPQVADPMEKSFVKELGDQCERLLNDHLEFLGRQRRGHMLESAPEASLGMAAQLVQRNHFLGALAPEVVQKILLVGAGNLQDFRRNAAAGRMTRSDLSCSEGPAARQIVKILNKAFNDNGVLDAVSAYMSHRMTVSGAALELSIPQSAWWANSLPELERAPQTLYAHLDESVFHPKAIAYLTDVTMPNGPTSCYPGVFRLLQLNPLQDMVGRVIGLVGADPASPLYTYYDRRYHQAMSSPNVRRHFMRLPRALRFNSHMGWDIVPGSELETAFVDREEIMTGPAGTFIVFDGGNLIHRGGLLQSGERIALQIIFSAYDLREKIVRKLRRTFK